MAFLLAFLLQAIRLLGGTNDVLTTVAAVNALSTSGIRSERSFRLHGTIVIASGSTFFFEDETARMWDAHYHGRPLSNGEIVSLKGIVSATTDDAPMWRIAKAESCGMRIAGNLDGNILRFSVADDGCGFDPANAPGVTDGHFGLHGIRERLASLNGMLEILDDVTRAFAEGTVPFWRFGSLAAKIDSI